MSDRMGLTPRSRSLAVAPGQIRSSSEVIWLRRADLCFTSASRPR